MSPRALVAVVVALSLAVPVATANAAPGPAGSLAVRACAGSVAVAGCSTSPIAANARYAAISADGATVYTSGGSSSNFGILAAWAVDRSTGAITLRNCISYSDQPPCTTNSDLYQAGRVVVGPHGVYVATLTAVFHAAVNPDGSLAAIDSCVTSTACNENPNNLAGIQTILDVAVTPDGRTLALTAGDATKGSLSLFGVDPATGAISTGRLACASAQTGPALPAGCTTVAGIERVRAVVATNTSFYAASDDGTFAGVYEIDRDAITGSFAAFAVNSCVQENVSAPALGCTDGRGLDSPYRMTLSPDRRNLYLVAPETDTQGYLATFSIAANGHLTGQSGCFGLPSISACSPVSGLSSPIAAMVSPDGRQVYVASTNGNNGGEVGVFTRDTGSGALTATPLDCIASAAAICSGSPSGRAFAGLAGAQTVVVDPIDGRQVIAAGVPQFHAAPDGSLVSFAREVAPVCAPAAATTTVGVAVGVSGCGDANGDPLTYTVASAPLNGTAVPAAAGLTYTPAAGFLGTDTFAFAASDGSLAAAPATATVTVGPTPVAPPPPTQIGSPPPGDAKPKVAITKPARHPTAIRGTASDDKRVAKVEVAIVETLAHHRCRSLASSGRLGRRSACTTRHYVGAHGTTRWSLALKHALPAGSYTIYARATDGGGQTTVAHRGLRVRA